MNLVIVESPAKCAKIQGFLGPGYRVVASMGHIRALEESLEAVGLPAPGPVTEGLPAPGPPQSGATEGLPAPGLDTDFEPRYEFLSTKASTLKNLREAAKGARQVYLAADDDREGEAIAYSVALLLKLPLATTPRIVFHEITETAIKAALASPRTLHMNRVWAQQARSMLDLLIGFTLSPLLWTHVARGLSAGRCQTPALKLLVEREETIQTFASTSSWRVQGTWTVAGASQALFATLVDELEAEEDALTYLENRKAQPTLVVHSTTVRPWTAKPPLPLMTSTLQQQASALFGMSPKTTMSIAQKLYEAGHITYMRTDTTALSAEATADARAWITTAHGPDYLGDLKPGAPKAPGDLKDGPKAQEAHEAIRPTHMEMEDVDTDGGQRLYTLIRNRALQSVMAPARGETCTVLLHAPDEGEDERLVWSMTQKRTTFEGWRRQGGGVAALEEDETAATTVDEPGWAAITALAKGHVLTWATLQAAPHETKAPGRMTEAILVRELEHKGIGRPSTFSSLIATVQDRGYATLTDLPGTEVPLTTYSLNRPSQWPPTKTTAMKRVGQERKKLVPTPLGLSALTFLEKHFSHLFAYSFTSGMETRLDQVEQGTYAWKQVLRDTWATYKDTYTTLKAAPSTNPKVKELGTDGLKAVLSKKGPLLLRGTTKEDTVFYGWPSPSGKAVAFSDMTEELARAFLAAKAAEAAAAEAATEVWNGHPLVRKTGPHGPYVRWNGTSLSVKADESLESIKERLTAKTTAVASPLKTFKDYVIRSGPYGPYILKPALKKPQFVSVPKTVTIDTLTESEVAALYTQGLAAKKRFKKD